MTTLNQIPTYIPVLTKTTKEVYDCYLAEYQIRRLRRTNRWVSLNECVREMRNFRTLIASLVGTLSALKRCTDHWDISTLTPRVDRLFQHHSQRKILRRDHFILLSVFQFWGNGSCVDMSTITFTGIRHTHTTTWKYPGKLRSYGSSNYLHYPVQSYDLKFTSIERSSRCLSFVFRCSWNLPDLRK